MERLLFSQVLFQNLEVEESAPPAPQPQHERWRRMQPLHVERRLHPRQDAHLLEVFLSDIHLESGFQNAQMTDFSAAGLGLWRFQPLTVGEMYHVGIPNAHEDQDWDTIFWIPVRVVYCRHDHLGWAMGCQFAYPVSSEVVEKVKRLLAE